MDAWTPPPPGRELDILTGHEAYEGLFATILGEHDMSAGAQYVYRGLIYEGEMPPMPDPLEPSAESPAQTPASE